MSIITVDINEQQLDEVRRRLEYLANGANKVMVQSLNKTANKARTVSSSAIRKQINKKAGNVRAKLKAPIDGYEYKAIYGNLRSKVSIPKRHERLDRYQVGDSPIAAGRPVAPIQVKVKPTGRKINIKSAFWVKGRQYIDNEPGEGQFLIAVRNENLALYGMKRNINSRLPYSTLPGPSISQVFNTVRDDVKDEMEQFLRKKVIEATRRLLDLHPPTPGDGSQDEE